MGYFMGGRKNIHTISKDEALNKMLKIITGDSKISLRIVDWFATNFAKKFFTLYNVYGEDGEIIKRFKVYNDYKLKLKAYSKAFFDPFCRWVRITIPYKDDSFIETTIGQLNFLKWCIENNILEYIEENYDEIERDMNAAEMSIDMLEMLQIKTEGKLEDDEKSFLDTALTNLRLNYTAEKEKPANEIKENTEEQK